MKLLAFRLQLSVFSFQSVTEIINELVDIQMSQSSRLFK